MDDRLNIVSSNIGVGNLAYQGGQVYTLLTTTDALEIVNQNFDAETIVSVPGNVLANAVEVQDNFFVGGVMEVDVDAETVTVMGDLAIGDVMAVSNVDATVGVQGDVFVGADLNDPDGYVLMEVNVGGNILAIDGDLSMTGNSLIEGTVTVDTDIIGNGDLTIVGNADLFENLDVGELVTANNVNVDNVLYFANALQNAAVVLYGPAHPDALNTYGLGLRTDTLRYSVGSTVARHAFYGNTTLYGNVGLSGFRSGNLGTIAAPSYSFVGAPDAGMLSSGVGNLTFAAAGNSFSFASGTLIGNASGLTRVNLANTYGILSVASGGTGANASSGSGSVVLNVSPTMQGNVTISGNANVTGRMVATFYQGDGGFIANVKSTPVGDASSLSNINLANTYGVLAVTNGGTGVASSTGSGNVVLNVAPTFLSTVTFSASGSGPYYGTASAYNPGRFANISAGGPVFNGNGGVFTSGGGLRLMGQDLTATPATGAAIEIEGGLAPLGSGQGSEIRMYTSGSQRVVVNNSGSVGIGTANPSFALHVAGSCYVSSNFVTDYFRPQVNTWHQSWGDNVNRLYFGSASHTYFGTWDGYYWQNSAQTNVMALTAAGSLSVNGTVTAASGSTISFYTNGSLSDSYNMFGVASNDVGNGLIMFVNGSARSADGGANTATIRNDVGVLRLGNSPYNAWVDCASFGVGTGSPGPYKLHVYGNAYVEGNFRTLVYYNANDTAVYWNQGELALRATLPTVTLRCTNNYSSFLHCGYGNFYILRGATDTGYGEWATYAGYWPAWWNLGNNACTMGGDVYVPNGRLGVGTNAPSYAIHCAGTCYINGDLVMDRLRFVTNTWHQSWGDNVNRMYFAYASHTYYGTWDQHVWQNSNGTNIVYIDASGHLYLNYGNFYGYGNVLWIPTHGGHAAGYWGEFQVGNGDDASFSTCNTWLKIHNGLGIKSYNDGVSFVFNSRNGYFYATGDIVAFASDERLKTNIRVIDNALDKVKQLRGVHFDWRDDTPQPMRGSDCGLIAQDVERVLPEATRPAPFDDVAKVGYLTIASGNRIDALLVEAIKDLSAKCERLSEEIERLKRAA